MISRTITTIRALPEPLPTIKYQTLDIVSQGGEVCEEMQTRSLIDQRSDAKLEEARQCFGLIRRLIRDKNYAEAYRLALIGEEIQAEAIELDAAEDDPCDRALRAGQSVQTLGRATVTLLQGVWAGGKGDGAA